MDENDIKLAFAVVAGLLGIIFGQKPLIEYIKEWKTKQKRAKGDTEEKIPSSENIIVLTGNVNRDLRASPVTESFKEMMQTGKYKEALAYAEIEREKLISELKVDGTNRQLELADFDTWHARALIYTGETQNGLKKLNDVINELKKEKDDTHRKFRKNLILGRAHNDRGYANWMYLGHYKIAIQEFSEAIHYFAAQKNRGDQLATACDNLGRVYSQLGNRIKAELLIEHGRNIRANLGENKNDRYALSLISSSITHLSFGDPYQAMELSADALKWFSPSNKRGQGLALIIRGQSKRYIGSLWTHKRPEDRKPSYEYLDSSLADLYEAETIFKTTIYEPIRLLQVYNEIGCTHRELSQLEAANRNEDGAIKRAEIAHDMLEKSLDIARANKYEVAYVDGCEDLARLYKNYDDLDASKSQHWLSKSQNILNNAEKVIENISSNYIIRKNKTNKHIPNENYIDDFWQILGKIYLLRGHIVFDSENRSGRFLGVKSKKTLSAAMENYALAMGYFGRFLESAELEGNRKQLSNSSLKNHRVFSEELYWRLRNLNYEMIKDVNENILPKIIKEYDLQNESVNRFYKEVEELLVQVNRT